jgi:hypothetical protein
MGRKRDRLQNMMEANKGLLKEDHEHSDSGKMDYIKGALKNLSSDDLDKIYLSVEKYDPEYNKTSDNPTGWK